MIRRPRSRLVTLAAITSAVLAGGLQAQSSADTGFAGVQSRGAVVMGVDQSTSHHVFEDLPDGGRIVLVRDVEADTAGAAVIRRHLRIIADSFAAGVFSAPMLVHAREVPGTATMARLRDRIQYAPSDRPGGGELRLTSSDTEAIRAIHQFLAFQRMDHHAAGHEGMQHTHTP
jgi:hypothetical protein